MMMKENRYFIAVPLPSHVKRMLFGWHERRRGQAAFRKWVYEQDYHITLKYLGSCDNIILQQVKTHLANLLEHESFRLTLSGIGTFGRLERPRILWAGVGGDLTALHSLQASVEASMHELGFAVEDRPYRPHVTIAKQYLGARFDQAQMAVAWEEEMKIPVWEATSIVLYRTELGRQPMYVSEEEYELVKR